MLSFFTWILSNGIIPRSIPVFLPSMQLPLSAYRISRFQSGICSTPHNSSCFILILFEGWPLEQVSSVRCCSSSMSLRGFAIVISPPFTIPVSTLHLLLIHLCSSTTLKICTWSIMNFFLMIFLSLARVWSIIACSPLPRTGVVLLAECSWLRSVP